MWCAGAKRIPVLTPRVKKPLSTMLAPDKSTSPYDMSANAGTIRSSSNILSLVVQYIHLIMVEIARTRGVFQILSFGFALAALVSTFRMKKTAPGPA
eukprot:6205734-Pleurochrysis_carterae.AAC.2